MSRLRVRIELNRGGVGVPLDKLASVVQQAQSFFRMLGDDVHIDQSQGDWLGFDFDHESLNFTAEFVGPVTQDQVAEFHAAFDGTTPLRRATIAQFARIADAIEEDEVIGFGLYLNEGDDPGEWRCLSRRDALRITEEINVLLGAGQAGQESHLPVAADVSTSARYMFGRRDRGVEAARLTGAVREVEANLSKRISRLESDVADHSGQILDLRTKSVEAEQSMGRLLSAVEGFCEQAANRLETVTAPGLSAAAAAGASQAPALAPALSETLPKPEPSRESPRESPKETNAKQDEARASSPSPLRAPLRAAQPVMTAAPFQEQASLDWWRSPMVLTVGLGTVVILLGILFWPTSSNPGGASASETVRSAPATVSTPPVTSPASGPAVSSPALTKPAVAENPAPAKSVAKPAGPVAAGATRIELVATEPTWVSIRGGDGATQMSGLIDQGKTQNVDVRQPAVLRAGNAGGLTIRTNGKSLGPLGPHGAVREVEFKNGEFKIVPIK
jgi:RodZ C-terminal domain